MKPASVKLPALESMVPYFAKEAKKNNREPLSGICHQKNITFLTDGIIAICDKTSKQQTDKTSPNIISIMDGQKNNKTQITFNLADLKQAMNNAAVFAREDSGCIHIHQIGTDVYMTAHSAECGHMTRKLDATVKLSFANFEIGFDYKKLTQVLKSFGNLPTITMQFNTPKHPVFIQHKDRTAIIMPMRIEDGLNGHDGLLDKMLQPAIWNPCKNKPLAPRGSEHYEFETEFTTPSYGTIPARSQYDTAAHFTSYGLVTTIETYDKTEKCAQINILCDRDAPIVAEPAQPVVIEFHYADKPIKPVKHTAAQVYAPRLAVLDPSTRRAYLINQAMQLRNDLARLDTGYKGIGPATYQTRRTAIITKALAIRDELTRMDAPLNVKKEFTAIRQAA